jgi:threonine dehydratase
VKNEASSTPPRLSLERIAEAAARIDPVFLRSPQVVCEPLVDRLGCRVTLKVETVNPIRSFKGRGADYFVQKAIDGGERRGMVCASAGNFGQGMAYACRKHGLPLTVFAAPGANPLKLARMRALGAEVRLSGDDFDAAKEAARRFALERGALFVEDGFEPHVSEGAGSIAVELLAHGASFDAVVVPLGDGALLNGLARWIKAAAPATRMIGVCSRGAPAVYEAWRRDLTPPIAADRPVATIADGIAVRVPVAAALADMRGVVDDVLLVDDDALIASMALVQQHAGLVTEPAGVAGVAAILEHPDTFAGANVATVLCGGNVTPEQLRAWRIHDSDEPTRSPS